jgi:serine phosphatase RsbU (regulator of sigma subunit)
VLEYGEERLNAFLREHRELSVDALIERVRDELRTFRGKDETDDDITLIGLKIEAAAREISAQVGNI